MNIELATRLASERRRALLDEASTRRLLVRTLPSRPRRTLRRRIGAAITVFGHLVVVVGEAIARREEGDGVTAVV